MEKKEELEIRANLTAWTGTPLTWRKTYGDVKPPYPAALVHCECQLYTVIE